MDFLEQFDVPAHKVASASLTDDELLRKLRATGRTIILSTGMSTMRQIRHAVEVLGSDNIILCHATSTYPAPAGELNLRMIHTLQGEFPNVPIGYSGHETGLQTTLAAVAMGAVFVERHITLDRAMWGSDQAASVEPPGLQRLVRDIRVISEALGDGVKKVYEGEKAAMKKLRRVPGEPGRGFGRAGLRAVTRTPAGALGLVESPAQLLNVVEAAFSSPGPGGPPDRGAGSDDGTDPDPAAGHGGAGPRGGSRGAPGTSPGTDRPEWRRYCGPSPARSAGWVIWWSATRSRGSSS